ncbi:hypothetical protein TSUD_37570 [Trifolium subterraneum]|uniref:Uncharacterized protein n=1 Tax=Trifolium subterraneum TaxID=3900 RepID=A0A2Z6M4S9_TRISU|nr:hypothetical protein TSUD_37570 [Trifolium subterraneum]
MRKNRREIDRERTGERSLLQGFPLLKKSHYSIHQVSKNLNMLPAIHVSFSPPRVSPSEYAPLIIELAN